jgi:membrane protein YqaA with SNARE-associated domain
MAWAEEPGDSGYYIITVTFLALISYGAGVLGYWIGRFLNQAVLYRYARRRFFTQYETLLRRFGGFLLFVAAVTPLPYSAICMLLGSVKYKFRNFLLISLTRFLRFAFYSYLLWQAGSITL